MCGFIKYCEQNWSLLGIFDSLSVLVCLSQVFYELTRISSPTKFLINVKTVQNLSLQEVSKFRVLMIAKVVFMEFV